MSTFDGVINEFPSIRIDYFRKHLDKIPPQACFLSHVHSDHLQGLESLKMPFVYCSAATKKILLRMEKYPHRINFAKGILEARKQTYKSLRLVLRPLPLETPVEIELDPKSKIRVTLFDANHCPGAVMFLIEGSGRAILYTGDVRAESWWVNSIVRNPILLPYACGAKTLNCMYLDTTFASRNDIYEHFPSKAEGLKELLSKVSKCSRTSTLYFRSWTLGYEDVWIALSNFLQSPVHVDDYQLRIFRALADDTSNTDRGPALAGFSFGNHYQFGCLTDNSTVSIHSCEPGTECHDRIKRQDNVTWITPIISRTKDGIEIPELGAGGGGGDLYQVPQLELIDETALEALGKLCAGNIVYEQAFSRLAESLAIARAKGDPIISLEGLEFEQDEEISLKHFLHLISRKNEEVSEKAKSVDQRTIRFPYSRHSSFSELRQLVSSFKPKDICPCTVDLDQWSEEVSMQALFGDLCCGNAFRHDQKTRSILANTQVIRSRKRKRDHESHSQKTQSDDSLDTEEAYRSAKTSLRKEADEQQSVQAQTAQSHTTDRAVVIPHSVQQLHRALSKRFNGTDVENAQATSEVAETSKPNDEGRLPGESYSIAHGINSNYDDKHNNQPMDSEADNLPFENSDPDSEVESITSLQTSVFYSQDNKTTARSDINTNSDRPLLSTPSQDSSTRVQSRKTAYYAAKAALDRGRPDEWNELGIRSLGWKGHTEVEMEL